MRAEGRGTAKRVPLPFGSYFFALSFFVCACASARLDVIQTGPWFPARDWREVEVFSSRSEIRAPWGGIGIIHSPRVSAETGQARLDKMRQQARRQAAEMGADGVILSMDSVPTGPQLGVYQEPEVFISALAIKYVTAVSTPSAK